MLLSRLRGHKEEEIPTRASILPEDISLEFHILLSTCRSFLGTEEPLKLEERLQQGPDWDRLLALASRHGVMPLLYRSISQSCPKAVPQEWLMRLRMQYMQNTARNYKMTAELLRVLDALQKEGIKAVPLKGPVLAQTVYGDIALRTFCDLDILVTPENVERALGIMQECGYRSEHEISASKRCALMKTAHHHHLFNAQSGITAELHWMIAPSYYGMKTDAAGILSRSGRILLLEKDVAGISAEDMLILLCQHGTKHTWEKLSWICDVAGLAAKESGNLPATWQRAKKAGEERVFLIGILLARELLLLDAPEDIALRAGSDETLSSFARQAVKRLFSESSGLEDLRKVQVDHSILYMSLYRSPYKKARFFLRMITDPADVDLSAAGLPDGMLPLYRLIKLLRMMETYGGAFCGWLRRSRSG
jgi:Fe2+ or Zn2+ uptake regulation protein